MKPIRVLVLFDNMDRAGDETIAMNYMRHMNREKIQYDFLVNREASPDYEDEINAMGGHVYHMSPLTINKLSQYKKQFRFFLAEHEKYDIIHSHLEERSVYALKIARDMGVKIRICHGHSRPTYTNFTRMIRVYLKFRVRPYYTHGMACSPEVAKWLFGHSAEHDTFILKNAIETDKFTDKNEVASQVREELGLGDSFVMGHIGRFAKHKNQKKLLNIFAEVHRRIPNSKLIMVGGGNSAKEIAYKEKIARRAREMQIIDSVVFTGTRNDVERIIQAFDIFVMPSTYEGFPIALIEAQAAGIKCVISDEIDLQCNLTGDIEFLPLAVRSSMWANTIIMMHNREYEDKSHLVQDKGYDINDSAKKLEDYYIKLYKDAGKDNK